jgi:hypothetical protein
MTAAEAEPEVQLEGLLRKDAVVLAALVALSETGQQSRGKQRTPIGRLLTRLRWRPKARLRRLEARGLVEPGWTISTRSAPLVSATPTPLGRRTSRAAMVTLMLEIGAAGFDG